MFFLLLLENLRFISCKNGNFLLIARFLHFVLGQLFHAMLSNRKWLVSLLASLLSFAPVTSSSDTRIKHFVVLMLENRSFDHLLGFLKKSNPQVDGCLPSMGAECSNPGDPTIPSSPSFPVTDQAVYKQISDPNHSVENTAKQVYGKQLIFPCSRRVMPTPSLFCKQVSGLST